MYVLAATAVVAASPVAAQMPRAPVLQNSWATPGIVVAIDIAGGSDGTVYGGAVGWAPTSGRFQFSGGAGVDAPKGGSSRAVYGARVAMPIFQLMGGKLGIAGFGGIGGGASKSGDTTSSTIVAPAGVAVGYRQAIGTAGRGFSVYLDPNYQYHSASAGNASFFRIGGGIDIGISPRFGVTVGFEGGTTAKEGDPGPTGGLYGVGISMKLGR